jgi:hypothetical protein
MLCAIVIGHAACRILMVNDALDDAPLNSYSPRSIDSRDYAQKAETLVRDGFVAAFGDGGRVPGYPVFLSVFHLVSDSPNRAARLAQVALASCIPLLAGIILLRIPGSRITWLAGVLVFSIWLPFYFFTPILGAESVALFLAACLCCLLSLSGSKPPGLWVVLCLAMLIYLKANHVLLVIPVTAYLWVKAGNRRKATLHIAILGAGVALLLLPWSIFASRRAGSFVPLSGIQGEVLLAGAGLRGQCYGAESDGGLPKKTALALDLRSAEQVEATALVMSLPIGERNRAGRSVALRAWRSRPFAISAYGLSKALHAFGFSFRDPRDGIMVVEIILAILASLCLWRINRHREWCVFLWAAVLVAALQAFVFLPDQRFKVVLVDFPALLVIVLAGMVIVRGRRYAVEFLRVTTGKAVIGDKAFLRDAWDRSFDSNTDLAAHVVLRSAPILPPGPCEQASVVARLRSDYPDSAKRTVATADRICSGQLSLFGDRFEPARPLDWHCDPVTGYRWNPRQWGRTVRIPVGVADIKMPWQLSRLHQLSVLGQAYWLTDDRKYVRTYEEQVEHWIRSNPVGRGVNWVNAAEASIRSVNLLLSFRYVAAALEPAFVFRLVKALFDHGCFIRRNLEVFRDENGGKITHNHYLANIAGLVLLGIFFKDTTAGRHWLEFGLAELEIEVQRQVTPDGSFREPSTSYHRFALESLACVALVCGMNDIELANGTMPRLEKMAEVLRDITRPDGLVPIIGDNDNARFWIPAGYGEQPVNDHRYLLELSAVLLERDDLADPASHETAEAVLWYCGPRGLDRLRELSGRGPAGSVAYRDGGYFLSRRADDYLLVTCGGIGSGGYGWHKHNDTGSFELCVSGRPFVVDPGCATYTRDPALHDVFRSSAQHNTLVIDGLEINRFHESDMFRLLDDARPSVITWDAGADRDLLMLEHRGYARLDTRLVHRRTFSCMKAERRWVIDDEFPVSNEGHPDGREQNHTYDWALHFAPNLLIEEAGEREYLLSQGPVRVRLLIESDNSVTVMTKRYLFSPSYGITEEATCLDLHCEGTLLPAVRIRLEVAR